MKEIVITQTYELTVSYTVEVADDMTDEQAVEQFGKMEIIGGVDQFGEMEIIVDADGWRESHTDTTLTFSGIESVEVWS